MSKTKIEYADATWSPVTGCTKISPACDHCWAERMSKRHRGRFGYPADDPFKVTLHPGRLPQPLHWRKPRRIFVCSMGDLFHDDVPDDFIAAVFGVMAAASQHTFLVLTKRPERMRAWFKTYFTGSSELGESPSVTCAIHLISNLDTENLDTTLASKAIENIQDAWPLPNVFLGVTAEDQPRADKRLDILREIPAAVRFMSGEPLLSCIDIERHLRCPVCGYTRYCGDHHLCSGPGPTLDWVIAGGESGPGARPMHPDWVRSLRDQCVAAGTKYFFKGWGDWAVNEIRHCSRKFPEHAGKLIGSTAYRADGTMLEIERVGKKAAGRELDGEVWDQFPEVTP